jgi:cell division septation protein DedD
MSRNESPAKGAAKGVTGVEGSSAKGALILLLALAVCFGYFYFFTDVLRSNEDKGETSAESGVSSTEIVKPLPERAVQTPITSSLRPAPIAEKKSPPASAVPAVESGKPQLPPLRTSASEGRKLSAPAGKEADARVTKAPSEKPASPGTAWKPAAPGPDEKKVSKDSAQPRPGKKEAASGPKLSSLPGGKQSKVADGETAARKGTTGDVSGGGSAIKKGNGYGILIGTYVLQSTLNSDKSRLEKAGLHPSISKGTKKTHPMNRLVVAESDSYEKAQSELERVKKASKGAFILKENGRFVVYAGSYYQKERAADEQERLRAQGFAPILKQTAAPVASWKLVLEGFPTREAAQEESARLRRLGFKPLPLPVGKN